MREHQKKELQEAVSCTISSLKKDATWQNRWVILPWLSSTTGWTKKLSQRWGLYVKYTYVTFTRIGTKGLYMLRDYKGKGMV